jgi:capsular polysaccharide biosynthesis protein
MNARPPSYASAFPPPMPAQPPSEPSARERIARLRTLARRSLQYWRVGALIFVVGMVSSLLAGRAVKLVYRSECTVLFRHAPLAGAQNAEGVSEKTLAAKLKDGLMARTRLEEVIKQFGLYKKTVDSRGLVDAVEEMRLHIGFRARDSETFVISFESEVPELAQQVTENLADSMIHEYESTNLSAAQRDAEFLTKQEQRSSAEFENANKALATFLTLHPEFVAEARTTAFGGGTGGGAPGGGGMAPGQPTLPRTTMPVTSDPQLAVLYRQKARLQEEIRNNGNGGRPAPGPVPGTGGESVAKLTAQRDQAAKAAATAAAELAERRTRLTDEHPDVISAKLTADAAARALRQAELALSAAQGSQAAPQGSNPYDAPSSDADVQRRISQLNNEIAARQDAVRRQAQVAPAGGEAGAAPDPAMAETNELVQLETDWQRLLGVVHDVRLEHDDLKQRLERARLSANAAEASGGDQMMVVDPAYKPLTPSKGGRTKTALAGGSATLIFALAYLFARVLFSDTIIDSADIEAMHLVPMLGVVPKLRSSNPPTPPGAAGGGGPGAGRKGNPSVG